LGDTNRFEPLQRTHKTDTATNAESSQELADIYENWADDASGRVIYIASVQGLVAHRSNRPTWQSSTVSWALQRL
jgi:hypothetical protein